MTKADPRSLSARAAHFAHELVGAAVPGDVLHLARLHLADAIGVGLAAASVAKHRRLLETLRTSHPAAGPATALGLAGTWPPAIAALMNGTSMHSLEFDDTHMGSIVHGSSVIVPAALAASQARSGTLESLTRLVVAGWEILVRLGQASPGGFQRRGFQVTSVGGAPVAALLAAVAKGLPLEQTVAAAGIAGSQAGGIFEFLSNGSNVKALHPGWAAHSGLWAADLAQGGMTGPETVLEGRFGLFNAYADDGAAGAAMAGLLDSLGAEWRLLDAAFKLYPCCHYIHPYLEAAESILAEAGAAPAVDSVLCKVAPGASLVICEPWTAKQSPRSTNEAKYSLPYCLARILSGKPIDLDAMTGERIDENAVALSQRIQWESRPESPFPEKFDADLTVVLEDGRRFHRYIEQVAGSAERPAGEDAIERKFMGNAERLLGERGAQNAWRILTAGGDLAELGEALVIG
ncbi:MmgE/PrpD family protein [Parapusillimonas sp. JC17]|uniref:MmgE/PrpD family protein n=1 Tax=Parapusillimonas sp. JC17 TaxID=3445768 RepID=UPI003FA12312